MPRIANSVVSAYGAEQTYQPQPQPVPTQQRVPAGAREEPPPRRQRGLETRIRALIPRVLIPSSFSTTKSVFKTVLDTWEIEIGITTEEQADRVKAAKRIEHARKYSSSRLDFSDLKLTSLPECIGNLTMLQRLVVNDNHLTKLPKSIGKMERLRYLSLKGNQLHELPEEIGNLKRLTALLVDNNHLRHVPAAIANMGIIKGLGSQRPPDPEALPESQHRPANSQRRPANSQRRPANSQRHSNQKGLIAAILSFNAV
jgi:Leucine-rich repeat (LRR) protein